MTNDDGGTASNIVDAVTESDSGDESETRMLTRRRAIGATGAVGAGVIGIGVVASTLESPDEGASDSSSAESERASEGEVSQTTRTTATPHTTEGRYAYRENGVGLSGLYLKTNDIGNLFAGGTATNLTDSMLDYVQVTVAFVDETDAQLETGVDNINDLAAGQQWRYAAVYPGTDTSRVDNAYTTGIDAY